MSLDGLNNEVRVILGGSENFTVEGYSVSISVMTVPAKFSVTLGHGRVARELMEKFPPGTPFELQVAGTRQFVGRTDGWNVSPSNGTTLELSGRDSLAPLHDACVPSEKTYTDVSFEQMTRIALDATIGAGKYTLTASDAANRRALANTSAKGKATKSSQALTKAQAGSQGPNVPEDAKNIKIDPGIFVPIATSANRKLQAKLGMRWFADLLKPQYNRVGLFMWSTGDGNFALTTLSVKQPPTYKLRHRRGSPDNIVKSFQFHNDTASRYSRCEVHGRRGGGTESRSKIVGTFIDDEMVSLGFDRPLIIEDLKCTTLEQAEFLARRKIAEQRRDGWSLSYTVAGHTVVDADGDSGSIWAPGLTVDVDDEELGISEVLYIHTVEHRGQPHMETVITLMRPSDAVFGEIEDS